MERLTTDKPVTEMSMAELAHNSCFAKDRNAMYRDYEKEYDAREFIRKIAKQYNTVYELDVDDDFFSDDDVFDETLLDWLQYDTDDMCGLIALFYRNMWAQADLYEVLKQYEGTGLTPEQIQQMSQMYQAKCEEINKLKSESLTGLELAQIWATLDHYEKLEEQGRLIELPCKVGDTVYSIVLNEIKEYTVFAINIGLRKTANSCAILVQNDRYANIGFETIDFGVTAFATREAAEKALEAMKQE